MSLLSFSKKTIWNDYNYNNKKMEINACLEEDRENTKKLI